MSKYTIQGLKYCREQGIVYLERVERTFPRSVKKYDLFGVFDYIGLHPQLGIIGIQFCSPSTFQEHTRKILASPEAKMWAGFGYIWLITARKLLVKRGGKARRWVARREKIECTDFVVGMEKDNGT